MYLFRDTCVLRVRLSVLLMPEALLVVNGVSGQSANLSVWNDGNGNVTVVDEDGRIGIGTSNPSHGLDVSGTGRFTGQLTADGALKLNSTLLDENNQAGTAGQILSSTGTGVDWIDATTFTDTDDQTLAEVLTEGNTTSGNNIVIEHY